MVFWKAHLLFAFVPLIVYLVKLLHVLSFQQGLNLLHHFNCLSRHSVCRQRFPLTSKDPEAATQVGLAVVFPTPEASDQLAYRQELWENSFCRPYGKSRWT